MERVTETYDKRHDLPVQVFNGKEYHLYNGERYFSRGTHRLHRDVWEFYNGAIPEGFHVHHKDENPQNNSIENLELVEGRKHLRLHAQEHIQDETYLAKARKNMHKAAEAAKEWHHSAEGREWHRLQGLKVFGNRTEKEYTCICCGSKFRTTTFSIPKFCSNKCKSKWRRDKGFDNEERICEYCGETFIANKYSKKRFCGRVCSEKYKHSKGV